MSYHYTESGLDNIYLIDGYTVHKTSYGEGVSIQNTAGLHKAIGKWLVARPIPLNGAELRFLRTEMELTQRDLAGIIGATEQTLRLWEKGRGKLIPGTADRLVRALYSEFVGGDVHIRKMLDRLAELDRLENGRGCFSKTNSTWKPLRAPQLEEMHA
ncbi:helix-turn-helix domain-containing protein [Bradyrhizobium barranii subsp. apii]|uniref:helix-turn-helix domain-containing protein n=1 Tax=Bradyrhizobium barranii TaxID=2992140 RepID=UPI001AA1CE02|nr:helix-turn-helix domain-containing protein [Bradyrhizobium barranii]UPT97269.1 helix-turn-helix domain-containing protein [Bradyrhizobium barranii subsp. apii]